MQNTTHGLSYDELSDEAQKRAIMLYSPFLDWDWYDTHVEEFTREMDEKYGIEVSEVEWGDDFDSWCKGRVWNSDIRKFLNSAAPEVMATINSPFHRIEMGLDLDEDFYENLMVFFNHSYDRYPRASSMEVELDGLPDDFDESIAEEIEEGALKLIRRELQKFSNDLRTDWDWMHSDEAAIEDYRANDTRFYPDGSLYE
jgi:hypothetical protein